MRQKYVARARASAAATRSSKMTANCSFIEEEYKRNRCGIGFGAQRPRDFIRRKFAAVRVPMGLSPWREGCHPFSVFLLNCRTFELYT
jgi:hypothetical protein